MGIGVQNKRMKKKIAKKALPTAVIMAHRLRHIQF